jgi:hypothetical protein
VRSEVARHPDGLPGQIREVANPFARARPDGRARNEDDGSPGSQGVHLLAEPSVDILIGLLAGTRHGGLESRRREHGENEGGQEEGGETRSGTAPRKDIAARKPSAVTKANAG